MSDKIKTGDQPHSVSLYTERAYCVAALARCALAMGLDAGLIHATETEWACIYIDTPSGQVAWHIAEGDLRLFRGLPLYSGDREQVYTTEEKYRRLDSWLRCTA